MAEGKDKIIKKIKKDAEKIAISTLEEAGAKAKELISTAHNDAAIFKQNYMDKSFGQRQEILQREENSAKLEVKKIFLARRQELVTSAYNKAIAIIKKDEKAYLELLEAMLSSAGSKGEVVFSKQDKAIAASFLADFNKRQKTNFTLSKSYGSFEGGIRVIGDKIDADMTLEAEITGIRDQTEPEAAAIIFGASND